MSEHVVYPGRGRWVDTMAMREMAENDAVLRAERSVMDELFGDAGRRDPHGVLRDAVIPGTSYAFVREVLHDRRFAAPIVPESSDLIFQLLARFMPRLPPERHAAVRRRFSGLFSARRVGGYREVVQARSSDLIDVMAERGAGDVVDMFAAPLPFGVIANALGVDPDQHEWLRSSMATLGRGFAGQRSRAPVEAGNEAAASMLVYFDDLLTRRARGPRDDLVSLLAAEQSTGQERADLI